MDKFKEMKIKDNVIYMPLAISKRFGLGVPRKKRFGKSINKKPRIIYLPNFLFTAMIKINRLQSILCRLFGNFHISNAKLKKEFKLPERF